MNERMQREIWAIGQQRLALLRFVLQGSIYRLSFCRWLAPGAMSDLVSFQQRWRSFNCEMLVSDSNESTSITLLRHICPLVQNGHIGEKEVQLISFFTIPHGHT